METAWYGVAMECPKCKTDCTLQMAKFSADGELSFIFYCPPCKEVFIYNVFAVALAHRALVQDLEKAVSKQKPVNTNGPVRPPLDSPPPKLTTEDVGWLGELHISPPDDGALQ